MKIAIIGLGYQTRDELIPALAKVHDEQEWVLCDIKQEFIDAAVEQASELGIPHQTYNRYGDIFRQVSDSLDAVVVSLPHFLYGDVTLRALDYGIPVFKEKPLAHNLKEAREIGRQAFRKNIPVYTVTKRQFYSSYNAAEELIRKGHIGRPYMYSARHFIPHGNLYTGWRSTYEAAGGGVFLDMGYHLLDVIMRYFGDISQVNTHWSNVAKPGYSYEVEDAASLHLWHPKGVHGVFQVGALTGPKEESIEIRGTEKTIKVWKNQIEIHDVSGELEDRVSCEANGVEATKLAMDEFFSFDKDIWSENLNHNLKMMKVINQAYRGMYE